MTPPNPLYGDPSRHIHPPDDLRFLRAFGRPLAAARPDCWDPIPGHPVTIFWLRHTGMNRPPDEAHVKYDCAKIL